MRVGDRSMYVASEALRERIILDAEMRSSSSSDVSNMFQRHLSFSESFICALSLRWRLIFATCFSRNVSRSYVYLAFSILCMRFAL